MGDFRFRPLEPAERDRLRESLRRNVADGAVLLTGHDTSFSGDVPALPDDDPRWPKDDEVIRAIKSVPCHYGRPAARPS
jgi:hypothetical protein